MDQHWRETKSIRPNTYFHNALEKYGINSFVFEEIDNATSKEELNIKEAYWISFYNSTDKEFGYNLDSGGSNGTKSTETKLKIGIKSKERWNDPDMVEKMISGLQKGTKIWSDGKCIRDIEFECAYCMKIIYLPKWLAMKRKYCSNECANRANYANGLKHAQQSIQEKSAKTRKIIAECVLNWCKDNKDIVLGCHKNKIEATLNPLACLIYDKYGIKDFRSIIYSLGLKNKKEFLKYVCDYILDQNIC